MELEDLKSDVAKIKWYHTIDLGNGVTTPGIDDSLTRLRKLGLPDNLEGMTVLDVGAWDGFYSFEAERRGASRVLATDSFCWGGGGPGTKQGFELARRVLKSRVEDMNIDVMDLVPERIGVFDLVLFLGVLYHMRHPLLALERVFSVTGRQLILETHVDLLWVRRPAVAFYPNAELHNDPTNWWGPNPQAVIALLKAAGFREVKVVSPFHSRTCMLAAATYLKFRRKTPFFETAQQNRMVFHAWR